MEQTKEVWNAVDILEKKIQCNDRGNGEACDRHCDHTCPYWTEWSDEDDALVTLVDFVKNLKIDGMIFRACPDRSCKYSKTIYIKRPGTPLGKGTAVCGLIGYEGDCDKKE